MVKEADSLFFILIIDYICKTTANFCLKQKNMRKKTVVIGASTNPERYSYKAVKSLLDHGHDVVPVGVKKGNLFGLEIKNGNPDISDVHTVTLYLGAKNQSEIMDYVISLKPQRVIFNPGTENTEFEKLLEQENIYTEQACTLVLLSTGVF
jgi:predicted CoA-binding protein